MLLQMDQSASSEDFDKLCFSLEKSLRYHQRRRAFFETVHRWFMFVIILLGSAAAGSMVGDNSSLLAFIAALVGAVDLVWAPGSLARDHLVLHQQFSALLASIVRTSTPTPETVADWRAQRIEIETDEPPIYWALEKDCFNEVCHALGRDKDEAKLYKLTACERYFMNFFRFERVSA